MTTNQLVFPSIVIRHVYSEASLLWTPLGLTKCPGQRSVLISECPDCKDILISKCPDQIGFHCNRLTVHVHVFNRLIVHVYSRLIDMYRGWYIHVCYRLVLVQYMYICYRQDITYQWNNSAYRHGNYTKQIVNNNYKQEVCDYYHITSDISHFHHFLLHLLMQSSNQLKRNHYNYYQLHDQPEITF